jgi:hypothetical protein
LPFPVVGVGAGVGVAVVLVVEGQLLVSEMTVPSGQICVEAVITGVVDPVEVVDPVVELPVPVETVVLPRNSSTARRFGVSLSG